MPGSLTCLPPPPPPPLLCWAAAEVVAKGPGPGGPARPVQLLQRISPWPPFFHMEEEVLRHTLHVGFSPSGILGAGPGRGPAQPQRARPPELGRPVPPPAGAGAAGSGAAEQLGGGRS